MSKIFFSESQIRQIIEKTNQIAESNNGSISIMNIEDSAALAAYIAGYSSWKQYRKEQKKIGKIEFNGEVETNEMKISSILSIDISAHCIMGFKEDLKTLQNKELNPELKENKQILYKIEVGQSYDKLTKATQICYLNIENTVFIGDNSNFLKIAENSLAEQLQTVIEFNSNTKNSNKLDPLNEIFSGDYLEEFLSKGSQNNKSFSFVWGILIKQLFDQYKIKFTGDFLLKTLELDFIMKSWFMLYQEGSFLANMLMSYIKTLPQIKIEPSRVVISKEAQEKHWDNIKTIHGQLSIIKEGYDQNIFSYDGLKLIDCMVGKRSVEISIPSKAKDILFNVVNFVIDTASRSYQKQVESFDNKEYLVFIVNKHEKIVANASSNEYIFSFTQLVPYLVNRISDVEQVVFTKHSSFVEPEKEFMMKFYLRTPNIEKNLFSKSGDVLVTLDENIAYLWKKESKETEIGTFLIQRIAY